MSVALVYISDGQKAPDCCHSLKYLLEIVLGLRPADSPAPDIYWAAQLPERAPRCQQLINTEQNIIPTLLYTGRVEYSSLQTQACLQLKKDMVTEYIIFMTKANMRAYASGHMDMDMDMGSSGPPPIVLLQASAHYHISSLP